MNIEWDAMISTKVQTFNKAAKPTTVGEIAKSVYNGKVKETKSDILEMICAGLLKPVGVITALTVVEVTPEAAESKQAHRKEKMVAFAEHTVLEWVNGGAAAEYEGRKANFLKKIDENPAHALRWGAEEMVKVQAEYELAMNFKGEMDRNIASGLTVRSAVITTAMNCKQEMTAKLLRGQFLGGCTNPMTNLKEVWELEAQAQLFGGRGSIGSVMVTLTQG